MNAIFAAQPCSTVASLLTPPGRGAVATIRITGAGSLLDQPDSLGRALCVARNGRPIAAQPIDRVAFAKWGHAPPEDVVVCRTADAVWELHCHGGHATVDRILSELGRRGVTAVGASPSAGDVHTMVQQVWGRLQQAPTLRTADFLLEQAAVVWPQFVHDLETADADRRCELIDRSLEWADFGRHLTSPWKVALCGRPNAGKSSLMNALAGFARSIVHDRPGTTRDVVTASVAFDGWPIELIDTAGLREVENPVEAQGVARARHVAGGADLVLWIVDGSRDEPPDDARPPLRMIPVLNKSDLGIRSDMNSVQTDAVIVSAVTEEGLDHLAQRMAGTLVPRVPASGEAIPVDDEQVTWLRDLRGASA